MNTTEKIIIAIVALVAIAAIVYFGFINKGEKVVYYTVQGSTSTRELIDNYKDFTKLVKEAKITKEITSAVDFSKSEVLDIFNEDYFTNKKVAVISTYEDTSRAYMYSVDKVEYDKERTTATIYYTDKAGEYLGTLKSSWYNFMFVEVDGTVTNVVFQKTVEE